MLYSVLFELENISLRIKKRTQKYLELGGSSFGVGFSVEKDIFEKEKKKLLSFIGKLALDIANCDDFAAKLSGYVIYADQEMQTELMSDLSLALDEYCAFKSSVSLYIQNSSLEFEKNDFRYSRVADMTRSLLASVSDYNEKAARITSKYKNYNIEKIL